MAGGAGLGVKHRVEDPVGGDVVEIGQYQLVGHAADRGASELAQRVAGGRGQVVRVTGYSFEVAGDGVGVGDGLRR